MNKFFYALVLSLFSVAGQATTIDFFGSFSSNADSATFSMSLPTGSLGTSIFTLGSDEGLDPVLSLYDSGMNLLWLDDDSGPGLEALLEDVNEPFWEAGDYFLVLSVLNDGLPLEIFEQPLHWHLVFESASEDISVSQVPLPAAAWLLLSGLGLVGLRRRMH